MRRGTRVGQAYVAITADGDGINEEIVRSVDDAGPGIDRAGDEHGERYGDHFSEGFFDRLKNRFRRRLAEELEPEMARSGDESGRSFTKSFVDGLDDRVLSRIGDKIGANVGGHLVDALNHAMTTEGHEGNALRDLFERMMDDAVSGNAGRDNERGKTLGERIGRIFGAGSRNNFLNLFGKSLGGIVSLVEKAGSLAGTFATNMGKAGEGASLFAKLGAGFTGGGEGLGGISGALKGIAASAPAAAAGVAAVVVGLSLMVSVAGALIALVTALAATITSALVGALAVAGAGILAVVAAGGLLVSAFMSMTDAQQALLKGAFLPLKEEMVGIAQIMLRDMVPAFAIWSRNLQSALLLIAPLAQVMGKAFAEAGNIFTAALSGPGFQRFAAMLTTFLPSITTRLSSALGSFLNGLLGIFAALLPLVNQFAGYLAQVAARFSNWANSAGGQNAIVDFVGRAVTALQSLWNFVSSFSAFLAKVLFSPEAQNAGNTIFDGLARTFRNFIQKVEQAQANGSFKKWFDDAIKFGGQLWDVISALSETFIKLYNSGVLSAIGDAMGKFAGVVRALNTLLGPLIDVLGKALPVAIQAGLGPLMASAKALIAVGDAVQWVLGLMNRDVHVGGGTVTATSKGIGDLLGQTVTSGTTKSQSSGLLGALTLPNLIQSGTTALNNTSISSGGFKPPAVKKKWKNPYIAFANSLIKQGPTVSAQIKNAILSLNKSAAEGIASAAKASSASDVQSSMDSLFNSLTTGGEQAVNTAQSALNNAAQSLASASTKAAAKKALKQVKASQKDLKAALDNQKRLQTAAAILDAQKIVTGANVDRLVAGLGAANATLADYAEARSRVADMLNAANQKLTEAIALRDDYQKQVSDSLKSFASLISAQAKVIDGVQQALTADDITGNLQTKLDQIKQFRADLQLLLAQGLSNDAYKQIVDAGVEQGTTIAEALLSGGNAAIQSTNSLVSQINGIADTLGSETSSRLYQAGVDAAQGLVDGLTSLSAQLDAAAYQLGLTIAQAVKNALGIASPSKVAMSLMDNFGDGTALGLDNQHVKVGSAAGRLAARIAVSPAASTYSSTSGSGVSGNGERPIEIDLDIITPTEDPHAVANEVINELVGRL